MLAPSPNPAGPPGRDFEAYYAAGATWNAGGDPWSRDIWTAERTIAGVDATRDELLPYVGPAAALPLWGALARLPIDAARALWYVVLYASLLVLVVCALLLTAPPRNSLEARIALLFCAVSAPAIGAVALAQAALVSAAGVAFACVALKRRSPWTIAGALAAALQPNLALPLLARCTNRRAFAYLALALALFLAIGFAAAGGPAGFVAYLGRLAEHARSERFTAIQYGLPAILTSFGVSRLAASIAANVAAVAAIAAAAWAACRFRAQPAYPVAIAAALLPFAVPFFHEHNFVLLLLPAIVIASAANARARLLTGIACVCVFVDWFGIAQRPYGALNIACLGLALACAYSAIERHTGALEPPTSAAAAIATACVPLATCAVLLAVLVPFALAHPAPMWPYGLGEYHAAASLDASAVWAEEQHRNGLDALVPAWGILRSVPLIGCVLLAAAGTIAARDVAPSEAA